MKNETKPSPSLEELIKRNIEVNEEILGISKFLKKFVVYHRVWSIFKWAIILVPIILGFIYLPPILREFFDQFQPLAGIFQTFQDINSK